MNIQFVPSVKCHSIDHWALNLTYFAYHIDAPWHTYFYVLENTGVVIEFRIGTEFANLGLSKGEKWR